MTDSSRALVTLDGVATTATTRQQRRLVVKRVTTEHPTLVVVRQGCKLLRRGALSLRIDAGDAVVIPAGQAFDLSTSPVDGAFVSTLLVAAQPLIDEFASRERPAALLQHATVLRKLDPEFLDAFDRAVRALREPGRVPRAVAAARVREVLVWLAQRGVSLGTVPVPTLTRQVRALLDEAPARAWRAREVARAFARSEATLRRHLRDEGLSFQDLLIDVRMSRALVLLQVSGLPIGQIAFDVGYQSASRFAVRFKKRFALSPSDVRHATGD